MRYLALILAAAVSSHAADPTIKGLLKRLESRYNRAETLQVQFAETYAPAGRAARTETGSLYLRKPGRMRWEYKTPAGKLFISDGKNVYLYLPSANKVEKMKLKESVGEDWRAPLAFLLGKLNFDKEFQNIQAQPQGDITVITAEPKSANLPYAKVQFEISPAFEIRKLHIVGHDQSVLDFVFDQERLNPQLAGNLFEFRAPAGAQIIEGTH